MVIGILGGTGKEGAGLALRWAEAGHEIIIGSRGLRPFGAALLGSVPYKVVHDTKVPVVVVR